MTRAEYLLATNDDDGVVEPAAVQRYLAADPVAPYGLSGWVGPEPHGASALTRRLNRTVNSPAPLRI
jgi:hypothetical protein